MIDCSIAARRRSALNAREETSVHKAEIPQAAERRKAKDTDDAKSADRGTGCVREARGDYTKVANIETSGIQGDP
jgi:hypothetical protein